MTKLVDLLNEVLERTSPAHDVALEEIQDAMKAGLDSVVFEVTDNPNLVSNTKMHTLVANRFLKDGFTVVRHLGTFTISGWDLVPVTKIQC